MASVWYSYLSSCKSILMFAQCNDQMAHSSKCDLIKPAMEQAMAQGTATVLRQRMTLNKIPVKLQHEIQSLAC